MELTENEEKMIQELRERNITSYDDILEALSNSVEDKTEELIQEIIEIKKYHQIRENTYEKNLQALPERKEIGKLKQEIDKLKQQLDTSNEYNAQQNRLLKFRKKIRKIPNPSDFGF